MHHMPIAYSYARFSSAEQAKGRSKNRQQEACAAYCEKHGLTLATSKEYTFLDEGKSAFKGEHLDPETGELARFIRFVENGSILPGSYLIVESLDRLGRDRVMDALSRFSALLNSGINIVTLTDEKCYEKDNFQLPDLMLSILVMSRAHEESSTKAGRVADAYRKKHSEARANLKPMGNVAPMWLQLVDGKYVEVPIQAEAVRRIFTLCIDGYGKAVIARKLNEEHVPSPKDLQWGPSSVDKVLSNRAVFGEYQPFTSHGLKKRQPHGNPIEGYFPTVVDRDTFYLAQEAIKGRRTARSTKQSKNYNVWSGVAKCGLCRSPLHLVNKGQPPKGGKYLRCSLSAKGGCSAKIIRLDQSELVFRHILARIDSVALVQDNAQKTERDLRICEAKLTEQADLLTQYREGLKKRYSETLADLAHDAEQVIKSLSAEKRALEQALADQRIVNRRDFVNLVDLDTYEGRNRANSLLKRLGIAVFIGQGYYVTQNAVGFMVMAHHEGKVAAMDLGDMEGYDGLGEEPAVQLLELMKKKAPFAQGW
jgi:DNA invertase Pin-like site-specific DNA recombinase/molybdopterin converting factor small subunit